MYLLEKGADPTAESEDGENPLSWAIYSRHKYDQWFIIKYLVLEIYKTSQFSPKDKICCLKYLTRDNQPLGPMLYQMNYRSNTGGWICSVCLTSKAN